MKEPVMKVQSIAYKRSLLIGMLLGDASSRKPNKIGGVLSAEFCVTHSSKQKDLVEWKAKTIEENFNLKIKIFHRNYKYSQISGFTFTQRKRVRVIHDWFHRGKRKYISDKIRFMSHPIGLAMLLCDDGSIRKRKKRHKNGDIYFLAPSITIDTHCFSEEEVMRLLLHIENICGAKGYINPERRIRNGEKKIYQRVNFNAENSKILWDYVSFWIPKIPSMMDKFAFIIERYGVKQMGSA
jgi:hypothetical protein